MWFYVVQVYKNMELLEHLFDAGQEPPGPQSLDSPPAITRFGYSLEDWNRSYIWIRTHQKAFHNATSASKTRHEKPAIIPAYITEDHLRGVQDEADQQTALVKGDLQMQEINIAKAADEFLRRKETGTVDEEDEEYGPMEGEIDQQPKYQHEITDIPIRRTHVREHVDRRRGPPG